MGVAQVAVIEASVFSRKTAALFDAMGSRCAVGADGPGSRGSHPESPMWVVKVEDVLAMTGPLRPHHILKAEGLLEEWDRKMFTIFVSHQWLSCKHPDPNGAKLQVLQGRPFVLVDAGCVMPVIVVAVV